MPTCKDEQHVKAGTKSFIVEHKTLLKWAWQVNYLPHKSPYLLDNQAPENKPLDKGREGGKLTTTRGRDQRVNEASSGGRRWSR